MTGDPDPNADPRARRAAVRDGYDALAEEYARERESAEAPGLPAVESLLAGLDAGDRLVDAGCGQGTPVLNRVPADVDGVGVDLSASQLALARGRTDAALVRGDLTALPVATGSAAAVTALHSAIHVPLEEHAAVYGEFARVLRPGGRLLVTAAPGEDGWTGANDDWLGSGSPMAWSFPGVDRTLDHLRDAGFRTTDRRTIGETVSDDDGGGEEDGDGAAWSLITAQLRVS